MVLGSINGINGATVSVNVGIGKTAPAYQLHLSANSAAKPGSATWTIASDERLKQDVTTFEDGLDVINKLHPVKYHYNGKAEMPANKEFVGVIAQEVQKIAPYMVGEFIYQDIHGAKETYLDYDANALLYILVNSVQQLTARNDSLSEQLADLRKMIVNGNPNAEPSSAARLWQSEPNPSNGNTVIRYFIPENITSAQIIIYAANGQRISAYAISGKGTGFMTISTRSMAAGTYIYHLVVNNKSVDSKKLILAK
jgi:hypothetical protein